MKAKIFILVLILSVIPYQVYAKDTKKRVEIELVFVLDTTGSMSGLIQGAKAKIWSIVNTIATAKPAPIIKVGLVAYRDRKDAYVTQTTDLSIDLDAIYSKLMGFRADGGGDFPEDVNKGLADAVDNINWSKNTKVIKMIYVVGDAPPHMDYKEDNYRQICPRALKKWINIHTVRCGNNYATEKHWKNIAELGDGQYTSVAQDGGMKVVSTPMDGELNKLNRALRKTFVAYGRTRHHKSKKMAAAEEEMEDKMDRSLDSKVAGAAKAERASYKAKTADREFARSGDLIAKASENKNFVDSLDDDELPDDMKKLDKKQRQEYIVKKNKEREAIKKKILKLDGKRRAYIKVQMAKNTNRNSFDSFVIDTLKNVAKKRAINLEIK